MNKLTWEEYYMAMVQITALRSKDPNTKVGAILINEKNRVIGTGYNGMPLGDDSFPWNRDSNDKKDNKYPYVIHAEMNAILNTTSDTYMSTIFVTLFPCSNCAKLLVQSGVKKVYYLDDKYNGTEDDEISKIILKKSKVETTKLENIEVKIEKK